MTFFYERAVFFVFKIYIKYGNCLCNKECLMNHDRWFSHSVERCRCSQVAVIGLDPKNESIGFSP